MLVLFVLFQFDFNYLFISKVEMMLVQ